MSGSEFAEDPHREEPAPPESGLRPGLPPGLSPNADCRPSWITCPSAWPSTPSTRACIGYANQVPGDLRRLAAGRFHRSGDLLRPVYPDPRAAQDVRNRILQDIASGDLREDAVGRPAHHQPRREREDRRRAQHPPAGHEPDDLHGPGRDRTEAYRTGPARERAALPGDGRSLARWASSAWTPRASAATSTSAGRELAGLDPGAGAGPALDRRPCIRTTGRGARGLAGGPAKRRSLQDRVPLQERRAARTSWVFCQVEPLFDRRRPARGLHRLGSPTSAGASAPRRRSGSWPTTTR